MNDKQTQGKPAQKQNEEREPIISKQILSQLGRPHDLISVQVRWLWNGRCRVNVICGEPQPRVGHSFFLSVDEHGTILEANPHVQREYAASVLPLGEMAEGKVSKP